MNSLFSSFDANGMLNWVIPVIGLMMGIIPNFWLVGGVYSQMWNSFLTFIFNDLKVLFKEGGGFMFLGLFLSVFMMNFLGLFPYIFTSSSHLCVSLGLGLPLWMGSQLMLWIYNSEEGFSHLVPEGSPSALIPLLVVIELISNVIRPMTLSIRLMANMVAGHLLLVLLGSGASINVPASVLLVMFAMVLMLLLELGVSLIQGYVFMLLSSLYVSETVH